MNVIDWNDPLARAYLSLLNDHQEPWRTEHQYIYAQIRDELARRSEIPPEIIQNHYEFLANLNYGDRH